MKDFFDSISSYIDKNFRDHHGLITYKDGNGGDTLQMIAFYYFVSKLMNKPKPIRFILDLKKLTVSKGIYIRHPDRSKDWDQPGVRDFARWNDPTVLSRDQLLPLCICIGIYGMSIKDIFKSCLKRFFRSQNGDPILGYHFTACFIRAPKLYYLYPIVFLTDIILIFNSIIDVFKSFKNPKNAKGYKNSFMILSQSYYVMPTPFSYIARLIYRFYGFQKGINMAFRKEDDPPFNLLYSRVIDKIF